VTPLATLLARIGWTTGELARRLDIPPDTTSRWARGTRTPPPDVLTWLAEVADAVASVDSQPAGWEGVRVGRRAELRAD
jgi:transcriptional regulator with XRE-family HTH domain